MTQNANKTARPVGDQALREALIPFAKAADAEHMKYVQDEQRLFLETRSEVCITEDIRGGDLRRARDVLAALAASPQTIPSQRDDGVREALTMARRSVLAHVEMCRPWTEKFEYRVNPWQDTLDAVDEALEALAAPGSAGPGEKIEGLEIARIGKDRKGVSIVLARSEYDSEAHLFEEPLPGLVVILDVDGSILGIDIEDLSANMAPPCGLATPATKAETPGPADQTVLGGDYGDALEAASYIVGAPGPAYREGGR